ncbi:MAG: hypothetical protein EB158_07680, partial [Nitrosopumilaceae archaeon]|nr:hypothetical protein [Nitrosopumilaceae archaeon]
ARAIQAERDRAEAARLAEAEETRLRESNRAHKAKINGDAVTALVTAGLSEAAARAAIVAIAKGEVPNVRISY